jgi:hypothetical protein
MDPGTAVTGLPIVRLVAPGVPARIVDALGVRFVVRG